MTAAAIDEAIAASSSTEPTYAHVFDECVEDQLPGNYMWPCEDRRRLAMPPCAAFVAFLLQNGVSPASVFELVDAHSDAGLPTEPRHQLLRALFL